MASALVCITLPTMTCPIASFATPDWASAPFAATTARSLALTPLRAPCMVPNAVRFAPRMTIDLPGSRIGDAPRLVKVLTTPRRSRGRAVKVLTTPRRSRGRAVQGGPGAGDHRIGLAVDAHRQGDLSRRQRPPLGHEGVAGPDRFPKLRREPREPRGVAAASALRDVAHHVPERAEPVQDRRLRKARHLGELGVGVQRVRVAGEPIEERLLRSRGLFDPEVARPALRHAHSQVLLRSRVATEAPFTAEEDLRR